MVLRSLMFVPGHNEKLLKSAAASIADALILDLEDSVPDRDKKVARDTVRCWLGDNTRPFGRKHLFVRINGQDTPYFLEDVAALFGFTFTGWVYPKATSAEQIRVFGKQVPGYSIIPLIETTGAVLSCERICEAPDVVAVAFGCEDFTADLQGIHCRETLASPRALIALAARTAGVIPIDTVHINVHDLEELRVEAQLSRRLGFEGMLVLHPKELPIVHECFTPTEDEVNKAREMVRLAAQAAQEGKGVAVMDGRFIGPPLVRQAVNVIERHERIQEWESSS